jgi:L-iditol 2-dehydrogenase
MRVAVLEAPGQIVLREAPLPEPGPGELVVRVETALTCGTDLKTFRRGHPLIPLPVPLGHEASGTVMSVGSGVASFREGDAVAFVPTAPCGACRSCRRGRDNLCTDAVGRMNFGAFADALRIPAHIVRTHVFHRPPGLGADEAAALEPLACVVRGARRLPLAEAESVVLLGDGPIALLFLQLARLRGAGRVMIIGRHEIRLAVARRLGADVAVRPGDDPLTGIVGAWSGGGGADIVVECVGHAATWDAAPSLAAPGGTVMLYGGRPAGERVELDAYRLHYEEVDVIGAFHYGRADVRDALGMLSERTVRIAPLITDRRPLAAVHDAFELALSRAAVKVAVEPGAP